MTDTQPVANMPLQQTLAALRRRLLVIALAGAVAWGLMTAAAIAVASAWADVLLDLPAYARLGALTLVAIVALAMIAALARLASRTCAASTVAQRLDAAAQAKGQIVAGADLSAPAAPASAAPTTPPSALTTGLAAMAVARAGTMAQGADLHTAAPTRPLRMPLGALAAWVAVIALLAVLAPDLASIQWARFTDPFGDHPPYSRVRFKVEPGDTRVVYGGGCDIKASVERGTVDQAEVVLRSAGKEEVLPMFAESPGCWRGTLSNLTAGGTYLVRSHAARSHNYGLQVITVPKIESVTIHLVPPPYTREAAYEGPLPPTGIAGLPGAQVAWQIKSNRPLSGGTLELAGAEGWKQSVALTPDPKAPSQVVGSLTLLQPAKLTLRVIDTAGQASQDTLTTTLSLLTDERPFVRILEPQSSSFATPTATLPITLSAEDDYGLSRLELYRSLNESRPLPQRVTVPTPAPRRHLATVPLALAGLGLEPGDVVKLFARVEDNDPAGAKGSESSVIVVQIISQEQFDRMIAARAGLEVFESKYAEARRRLEAAREAVNQELEEFRQIKPDGELTDEQRQKLAQLAKTLQEEAQAIRKLRDFKLPFDLDQAFTAELERLDKQLDAAGVQLKGESEKAAESLSGAVARLEHVANGLKDDQARWDDEVAAPLEHLAKIFPLIQDQAQFVQLAQHQADLAVRLAALKGQEGQDNPRLKARMRDLEAEQREVHRLLDELAENIKAHAAALPDDPRLANLRQTAETFLEKLRDSGAGESLTAAEDALAEFAGTKAHGHAQAAAEALDNLISRCCGMGDKGGACLKFQPRLASGLGNTIAQLLGSPGGSGSGAGGYSMESRTLQNIGVYGSIPLSATGGLSGNDHSQRSAASRTGPGGINPATGIAGSATTSPGAVGTAAPPVPSRYRRRVGQYFQRVAEELEQE